MKLEIDEINIIEKNGMFVIRLSIGGYIFLDTPYFNSKEYAEVNLKNIKQRLSD